MNNCVYVGETKDPEAPEISEEFLEAFLSDPDAFVAPCKYGHWEQEDYVGGLLAFRFTMMVENGDLRFNAVRMCTDVDGTPLFPRGDGWLGEDRVETADRCATGYICAKGEGQYQIAPDEHGADGIRGMIHFDDAQAFEDLRGLLARIRERGMQILQLPRVKGES